jgi:hypothetical protein
VTAARPTRLYGLGRERFLAAVTGQRRSVHVAGRVADERLRGDPITAL